MRKAEAELTAQIGALLKRAQRADEAEKCEPELDIQRRSPGARLDWRQSPKSASA